ncbi:MAG: hypothetical protein ACHRXM_07710 [Isosphaerales bacterium]
MTLEGFREESFTHDRKARPVYRRGSGPGVVVKKALDRVLAFFRERLATDGD